MSLLEDIIALEEAARRCIPRLDSDPVLKKCEFPVKRITLVEVDYLDHLNRKAVVLESCGALNDYIAEILREELLEEGFDAIVTFNHH